MEIELPDGTVLDAPDNADIKAVIRGYRRSQLAAKNPEEYNPASPEYQKKYGADPSMLEAGASGLQRGVMGMTNLLSKMQPAGPLTGAIAMARGNPGATDQALAARDQTDQAAVQAHPLARAGGEIASSLPLSLATGGAAGAPQGAGMLVRTLASPYPRAAIEGALGGYSTAPAGEQGEGAAKGAALSTVLTGALGVGGRFLRGLIQKSEEAQALEHIFAQHGEKFQAPISQIASDEDLISRLGKSFYKEALPLIPGVKGQLERQSKGALESARRLALQEAAPGNYILPKDAGKKVGESMHGLRAALGVTNDALESLEGAANAAKVRGGNFTMAELARAAKDPILEDLGVTGHAVLGQSPTSASLTGRVLAGAGLGGFGAYMSLPATLAAIGGGNIMATKAAQRLLTGDTHLQQLAVDAIEKHPEKAAQIASLLRLGASTQVNDDGT